MRAMFIPVLIISLSVSTLREAGPVQTHGRDAALSLLHSQHEAYLT